MTMERLVEASPLPLGEISDSGSWSNDSCLNNCSNHGECYNGVCVCQIQFEGEECRHMNTSYFVGLATVFSTLALVCLVQLVACVLAEWQRMKAPSLLHACRVTTQKLLYFLVFLASVLRATYFTSPTAFADGWASSLMSAYYPLLLSGSSLIVCFWAEVFHLRDIRWEKSQFLSKSFLAFVTFNLIAYSLLVAELLTVHYLDTSPELRNFYTHVFNGCYAVLLFIVVVFFLIYGVQVFFKVRGGFVLELQNSNNVSQYRKLFQSQEAFHPYCDAASSVKSLRLSLIDVSQLQQSRIGLLSQTLMLSFVVVFLCSETLSEFWKNKVPLHSRNWHDLLFRVVEIGVALWFPCVLWNCMSPEQLWILNPKRIIKNLDTEVYQMDQIKQGTAGGQPGEDANLVDAHLCFICKARAENKVCGCCHAHSDCLRDWCLWQEDVHCHICQKQYPARLDAAKVDWTAGFNRTFLRHCCLLAAVTGLAGLGAWKIILLYPQPVVGPLALGFFLLVLYVCVNQLWKYTDAAWKQAHKTRLRVRVLGPELATLSETVSLSLPQQPPTICI